MNNVSASNESLLDEDKRIRRLYQTLLERRPLKYWSVLDFPYLAEVVRHDTSYLRRILNFVFVDHPALSHCTKMRMLSFLLRNSIKIITCTILTVGIKQCNF